jgi:hypothetical protein
MAEQFSKPRLVMRSALLSRSPMYDRMPATTAVKRAQEHPEQLVHLLPNICINVYYLLQCITILACK